MMKCGLQKVGQWYWAMIRVDIIKDEKLKVIV